MGFIPTLQQTHLGWRDGRPRFAGNQGAGQVVRRRQCGMAEAQSI